MFKPYIILCGAILAEILGSVALKYSQGMSRLWPSVAVLVAYGLTFWWLSLALKVLPLGITSALWAGLGIVGSAALGVLLFHERLGWVEFVGMGMILGGSLVLTLFARVPAHA
ncbi:multidrug transporter [Cystobacter fuscus]|uniref:Multidrug transporter n=1 Tax=Cystobacter fuscus TaxID=43 RepID=A0A250J0Z4_9BACT|nr:multidrug efflux SMR transporter [Cystobacter fuscus]ATB37152.1 multidrug transporter [Cystobacter fuscus]